MKHAETLAPVAAEVGRLRTEKSVQNFIVIAACGDIMTLKIKIRSGIGKERKNRKGQEPKN